MTTIVYIILYLVYTSDIKHLILIHLFLEITKEHKFSPNQFIIQSDLNLFLGFFLTKRQMLTSSYSQDERTGNRFTLPLEKTLFKKGQNQQHRIVISEEGINKVSPPNVPAYSYTVFLGSGGRIVSWGRPTRLEFPGQNAEGKKTAHRKNSSRKV